MKKNNITLSIKTLGASLFLIFILLVVFQVVLFQKIETRFPQKLLFFLNSLKHNEILDKKIIPKNDKEILFKRGFLKKGDSIYLVKGKSIFCFDIDDLPFINSFKDLILINIMFDLLLIWVALYFYYRIFSAIVKLGTTIEFASELSSDAKFIQQIMDNVEVEGVDVIIRKFKELYVSLIRTEKKVNRKNQLETLGIMNARILHDLKNSLTSLSILIFTAKNKDSFEDSKAVLDLMDSKVKAITSALVDMLQALKDGKEVGKTKLDIEGIKIGLEKELCAILKNKGIKFNVNFDSRLYGKFIRANTYQIRSILENLCVNSINALEKIEGNKVLEVNFSLEGKAFLSISIKDNATGIPNEIKESLFEDFSDEKKEGIGLGLNTVKKYVDENGGTIRFVSDENGTIFKIYFPIYKGE